MTLIFTDEYDVSPLRFTDSYGGTVVVFDEIDSSAIVLLESFS